MRPPICCHILLATNRVRERFLKNKSKLNCHSPIPSLSHQVAFKKHFKLKIDFLASIYPRAIKKVEVCSIFDFSGNSPKLITIL